MHAEEEDGQANSPGHLARPGKVPSGTRHGRRPWSSPELRGQHGGVPRFARKIDGEDAGEEGSSPARRTEAKKARIGGLNAAKVTAFSGGVPCGCSAFQERVRVGIGAKCKRGGGSGAGPAQKARGAGKGGERGSGSGSGSGFGTQQQRDGCRRWVMTSGPRLVVRERKGERWIFSFFSNKFSKLLSNGI